MLPFSARRTRSSTLCLFQFSTLLLLSFTRAASADPVGDYQSWIWETGVFGGNDLSEEVCFGSYVITFAGDLTWALPSTTSVDVCWGRTTSSTGRVLDNAALVASPPGGLVSTRPLVNAGGKLWELYGEDVGGGDDEERLGTVLFDSTENLAIYGAYESFSTPDSIDEFRLIDMWVKSTTAVQNARTAAGLENTNWHGAAFAHAIITSDSTTEHAISTITSFALGESGSCTFSTSTALPGFAGNADFYLARQTDDGINLDNRFVRGGRIPRTDTACSYTVTDTFLVITRTIGGNPVVNRYVVSDNNQFLINAPAATLSDSSKSLFVGYRAASSLAATAIDGTYLFYLPVTEFGADGTGAEAAGFGPRDWQEFDELVRGKVVFDSTSPGTTPTGEGGTWRSCSSDIVTHEFEHEFTGSSSDSSIALGANSGPRSGNIPFTDCSFQLGTAGELSVFLQATDPDGVDEFILRGYVNDNGELLTLTLNEVDEDPENLGNLNEDLASILFLLGMKYTGNPDADADSDGLSNYGEFTFPMPRFANVKDDADGDGKSDILWRNGANGENAAWLMDGGTRIANLSVPTVSVLTWEIVGRGDYNGDGTADILWRNFNPGFPNDGQMSIWLMQGGTRIANLGLPTVGSDDWQVVGDGDYNGDGEADILWRNTSGGQNALWQINGGARTANLGVLSAGLDWAVVGDGDYNGDGNADILWRKASGELAMWLMSGATRLASQGVPTVADSDWQIMGDGDYDGDGDSDLLWRNITSGFNALWLMDGATRAANLGVPRVSDTNWQIVGDGDYNGDGMADILWRESTTSGTNAVWLMNGALRIGNVAAPAVLVGNWNVVNIDN